MVEIKEHELDLLFVFRLKVILDFENNPSLNVSNIHDTILLPARLHDPPLHQRCHF